MNSGTYIHPMENFLTPHQIRVERINDIEFKVVQGNVTLAKIYYLSTPFSSPTVNYHFGFIMTRSDNFGIAETLEIAVEKILETHFLD